ncbi:uncharacterized protein OCT59_006757 [Rhizophagus irregularis]|uniref:uncharacterized protein n=1 Tax=Rhizophagus irregularis TaxID=588596 RepID=UPI000CBA87FA|nr:hypothetical protein OCT59_006757 [Rhizophagus irregularis]
MLHERVYNSYRLVRLGSLIWYRFLCQDLGWNCMKSSSFGRIIHRVEQVKLIATLEMVNTKGPTQQLGIHPGVEQLKMRFRNNTAGKIMISLNLNLDVENVEDISLHGFLYYYDKNYDLIRTKSEKPLTPNDKVQYFDSTSKDPI